MREITFGYNMVLATGVRQAGAGCRTMTVCSSVRPSVAFLLLRIFALVPRQQRPHSMGFRPTVVYSSPSSLPPT